MDRPWFKSYSLGVPHEINPDEYTSLIDMFDGHMVANADTVAFINMGASLTYKQLHDLSEAFAAFLQSQGLQKGARVAIMMPNLLQYAVSMIGILRAGMTVVNVNPLYTSNELTHQLNDAGAEAMIVVANFAATVEQSLPKLNTLKHIIVTQIGDLMGTKGALVNFAVKYLKRMVPRYNLPQAVSFHQAIADGQVASFTPVDIKPSDLAFLQYTGGTTGVPKAAMLSHRNMVANVLQCSEWVRAIIDKDDVVIAALPMYHIFSLTVCCLTFIFLGAHCLLITNPRHMKSFLKILRQTKVSIFVGLNTLFNGLMQQPDFAKVNFADLKLTISGGMALQSAVAEHWDEVTGCHITEGYGLTEASPVVTINPITNTKFSGSIGLPISSTDITVRDDQLNDLTIGEIGELCVKGPQVMQGYYNRPDETGKVMDKDGWLHTGDLARIDENGFVYVVDRKKDMILVSGFNVYPNEIEDVIAAFPGIKEVAVIGVPDTKMGESIKAFVVTDDKVITAEKLIEYCRQHLTRYKIPKQVEFREELPKSNVGKVLRKELRQEVTT